MSVGRPGSLSSYSPAADLLRALASPLRIAIVMQLDAGALCVHELVDAVEVAQPLVSQHLRVLRAAGVVVSHRRGREVAYSLADSHVAHVVRDAVAHSAHSAHTADSVHAAKMHRAAEETPLPSST
jgi:DNA-binding transcriptional ArsR family regulator